MVLIHAYIEDYKNFRRQSFPLHNEYQVDYEGGLLSIKYLGQNKVHRILYGTCNLKGIRLVAGKTGAGKTNLFQLIGEDEEHRRGCSFDHPLGVVDSWLEHEVKGAYFFLYAGEQGQYYIECKDMRLTQFSGIWAPILEKNDNEIKSVREQIQRAEKNESDLKRQIEKFKEQGEIKSAKCLEKRLPEHRKHIAVLHRHLSELESAPSGEHIFWTAYFSQNDRAELCVSENNRPRDTLILDCYDRSAFLKQPYPDSRARGYRQSEWIPRAQAPYQRTSLWNICRYIREYTQTVEPGETKKQVKLQINNLNFEYAINAPVEKGMEKKLYRFSTLAKSPGFKRRMSDKEMFLHDLWVDYCVYLYKKIKQISMFPTEEFDESEKIRQEALDYIQDKENFPFPEATEYPYEYDELSVAKLCKRLAQYIDYKDSGLSKGILHQIWDDIKDIINLMRKLDDKYFTLTTFEMPVADMELPRHKKTVDSLFERMEYYHPDDMDLFDRYLLPFHFTHLSTGELQYARVFGTLYDYLGALAPPKEVRDYIILMDEPDAYLHPELSRQFLNKLLTLCRDIAGERSFQFFISTHTPLMLSDVPGDAVLRLGIDAETGNGVVLPATDQLYFGSNIHSIMADGFFLRSTIGEFSRVYLQQLQDRLRELLNKLRGSSAITQEERQWLEFQQPVVDAIGDELIHRGFQIILEQIDALTQQIGDSTK